MGRHVSTSTTSRVLRGLLAACVLLSAVVHFELWIDQGFRSIDVIGPAFLLNAIGGLAIGVAVLVWDHWLPVLAAIGFGATTMGAFTISATVGLFGVHEPWSGAPQIVSAVTEIGAVVLGIVVLVVERGPGRPRTLPTP